MSTRQPGGGWRRTLAETRVMGSIKPNPKKRSYLLPAGCKDLIDILKGPPAVPSLASKVPVNGQIRAKEVRVISEDGRQIGVLMLGDALVLAKSRGIDLVEIAPLARPPVCRLVDFGKFCYERAKRRRKKP